MKFLLILILLFVSQVSAEDYLGVQFPYGQLGSCYDSVQSLGSFYEDKGHTVTYLYSPRQDHVWLLVDYQQVDIYWGTVPNGTWQPEFTYSSYEEFLAGVNKETSYKEIKIGNKWVKV